MVLRPTAVYGPREKDLLLVVKSVHRGMEVYIGSDEQKLSFVYVKDLATLAIGLLDNAKNGEFYNVSDGRAYDRYAFANAIKKATGGKTWRLQLPKGLIQLVAAAMDKMYSRSSKTPALNLDKVKELTAKDWSCSIEKARLEAGFSPVYDLETGMAETILWYKANRWL